MKKNYIKPTISIEKIELGNLLAASDVSVAFGGDEEDVTTDAKPVIGNVWDTWEE